jgi:Pyruvate phosphate dikinase, AMP/ATP-binding domain
LPFGVCERVLTDPRNQDVNEECRAMTASLDRAEREAVPSLLARLRDTIMRLQSLPDIEPALRTVMHAARLSPAEPWSEAWRCVTQVWASKWNERAYWSRRIHGIPDEGLVMAVLIQEAIAAEYAFVIHTANQTLVGNHSGCASSPLALIARLAAVVPLTLKGFPLGRDEAGRETGLLYLPPETTRVPNAGVATTGGGAMLLNLAGWASVGGAITARRCRTSRRPALSKTRIAR